jgi:Zinc knuckle
VSGLNLHFNFNFKFQKKIKKTHGVLTSISGTRCSPMVDNNRHEFHRAHPGGLDFNESAPGASGAQRVAGSANGWFIDAPEIPASASKYKTYLSEMSTRFVNQLDGYKSTRLVNQWFVKAEALILEKAQISKNTFGFLAPALSTHYGVALSTYFFTEAVPVRNTGANNPLLESVQQYNQSLDAFRLMRQRFVAPFARQILYTMVTPGKRAEVAQALTAARGAVNKEGDVADYIALKDVLSSKAFTQIETLDEAVFKNGMPKASAAGSGSLKGVTRTVVMAMKEESTSMYNYMIEEHAARVRAAGNIDTVLYTGRDLMAIADKLILGHHLGTTLPSAVLETLRLKNLIVTTDVNGVERIVLEVPLIDADGVLDRCNLSLRKAWHQHYSDALPTKKDGPLKRKKATVSAETAPPAVTADAAAAEASGPRSIPEHQGKRSKSRAVRFRDSKKATPSSASTAKAKDEAGRASIDSAQPPRNRPTSNSASSSPRGSGTSHPAREQRGDWRDMSTVQCYNCAEMGHFASRCPEPKVRCSQCQKNHRAGSCIASRLKPLK